MAKGNTKNTNGSALEFEAQLWAAAEQAAPAPNGKPMDDLGVRSEGQNGRWKYGTPSVNNANDGLVQHFIHHHSLLGIAGFDMANGSMSTQPRTKGRYAKH